LKGDDTFHSIAAASILAKYERDKYIDDLCEQYPLLDERYGLKHNKGYGTAQHIAGLERYGATAGHRMTFKRVKPEFSILDMDK
jgi:ribonuclease HII